MVELVVKLLSGYFADQAVDDINYSLGQRHKILYSDNRLAAWRLGSVYELLQVSLSHQLLQICFVQATCCCVMA